MTAPLILVGDNSQVVREVLRWHLESHGYEVLEAGDGAESVALAEQMKPAAILLSVELPVLNGYEALTRLKADPELRDTPVVFITAHAETEDVVEGLRLGAHDYLRKPFEPAEVIARVSAAVRVKELQDVLRARNAELDHIARSDPLTGLANRRHLDEQLAVHAASAARHHHELSVAVVDIETSRASTTHTATAPATPSCGKWPGGSPARPGSKTSSAAGVARSSSSSCPTAVSTTPPS